MTPMVLTFAGKIASGKSTLSRHVATALNWPWTSFGDYVRAEAQRQGMNPNSRPVLQQVSDQILGRGWHPFCRAVLETAQWTDRTNIVLDGVRHSEALTTLRDIVFPHRVALVFVNTPDILRKERLQGRGMVSENLQVSEHHASELQARTTLINAADLIIDGTLSIDEATHGVIDWLSQPSPGKS
jgi:cytidylate kinase